MKKIHITEEQLNYLKKKLTEAQLDIAYKPTNGKPSIQDMQQQVKAAERLAPGATAVNIEASPQDLNITENAFCEEGDSEGYRIVLNYLKDIEGLPEFYRLMELIEGNIDEEEYAIEELCKKLHVRKDSAYSAIREFQKTMNYEYPEWYEKDVMEGKIYTKKQIKEAKLEKLKKSCKVIKKKDI